jgi:hypothetical protein
MRQAALARQYCPPVWVRRTAGILILLFGVYTLAGLGGHACHGGKQAGHDPSAHQSMPQENQ